MKKRTRIQVVWAYGELTELARMSLASYLSFGYQVVVWTYGQPQVPEGVEIRNATELLSREEFESYRFVPSGQLALACDLLSWKASERYGGWMGHLDVTLNRPLPDYGWSYIWGPHHRYRANFSIWYAYPRSKLIQTALRNKPGPGPTDWHAFMATFSYAVDKHGLRGACRDYLVNDDGDQDCITALLKAGSELPAWLKAKTAVHWMGSGNVAYTAPEEGSYYAQLRDKLLGRPVIIGQEAGV